MRRTSNLVTNPVPGYKTVAGNGTVTPGTFTSFVKATRKAYPGTAVPAPVDDGPSIVVLMPKSHISQATRCWASSIRCSWICEEVSPK